MMCICMLPPGLSWQAKTPAAALALRRPAATLRRAQSLSMQLSTPLFHGFAQEQQERLEQLLLEQSARDVSIRPARASDRHNVAVLCTNCFFGVHLWSDGPVIFWQRAHIFLQVLRQVTGRLAIADDRECRLLVATDRRTGELLACVDIAVHLFDRQKQRFELATDRIPMSHDQKSRFVWLPYVASLAVSGVERRRGLGRKMMRAAEAAAREWGHAEVFLEVGSCNSAARRFYEAVGYRTVGVADADGGGRATAVRLLGWRWEIVTVEKLLMRKHLSRPARWPSLGLR